MIQIGNIPLPVGAGMEELRKKAAKALGIRPGTLGELTIVPANVSSIGDRNNYQPTPYEPGTEGYDRVLQKLDGTWTGPNLPIQ